MESKINEKIKEIEETQEEIFEMIKKLDEEGKL